MTYWENLKEARSLSRVQRFDLTSEVGAIWPLIKPATCFLLTFEGKLHTPGQVDPFKVHAAPAHSSWKIEMEGAVHQPNGGRIGMKDMRVDGKPYSSSVPYIPRPNFTSPAVLAFYSELPIWGSTQSCRFSSEFTPSEAWIGNDRFMRIVCRADQNRGQKGSSAEVIVDLLHKMAVYYSLDHETAPPTLRMEVHSAEVVVNPISPEISELYSNEL